MSPRMELAPNDQIRYAWDYWTLEEGRQEWAKYINIAEAEEVLKEFKGEE